MTLPGGVWGANYRAQGSGFDGYQQPRPESGYSAANRAMLGGGSSSYFGRGDDAIQKRQFADVGKVNVNLLDPLAPSRAEVNYQPIDGEDGGFLGVGNYYNARQPGGLFAGLFGAIGQTLGGVFGEETARGGSDVGTFLGKTLEMPMAAVGGVGVAGIPFITPIIDQANSAVEVGVPYILRDTFKIPTNLGGVFQSMLNIFGLAGTAIERTYAGMENRGPLPKDIEERIVDDDEMTPAERKAAGKLTRDEGFDEMVLSARGYSDDPLHNMLWAVLLDPANWASLGVGATGAAVRGTSTLTRAFGAAVRADSALAGRLASEGGEIAAIVKAAQAREPIAGMITSRGLASQMRTALDGSDRLRLTMVERMGMSALGPVSEETGNAVARVGNYILRATDPVNFFSGSKAGKRSMELIHTASATAVMAAWKPQVVLRLANLADAVSSDGSERIYRMAGTAGGNAAQEVVAGNLADDAMKIGAIPHMDGTANVADAARQLLRGGAYDTNIGKVIEVHIEKTKDLTVLRLSKDEMRDQTVAKLARVLNVDPGVVAKHMTSVSEDEAIAVHAMYYVHKATELHTGVEDALKAARTAGTLGSDIDPARVALIRPDSLTKVSVKVIDNALASGDLDALRAAVESFVNFSWLNRNNVPDTDLKEVIETWLEGHRAHLLDEVELKDAMGVWRTDIPQELIKWAEDQGSFGYKLGLNMGDDVPLEAKWRVTRRPGPNGELLNADPYLDFWVEGGDNVRRLNRWSAMRMASTRGIRQERIVWAQRRRFITDMAKAGDQPGGVSIPPALADRIFKALMYEAKERFIQPRGLEPREMYAAARNVLEDARHTGGGDIAHRVTERQIVLGLLRAMQGEVGLVGVTQKVTGGIKAYAPGSGSNYWGRISEKLYPLMRFTLNGVFQTMELAEVYVLSSARGIKLPLRRSGEAYQNSLASRNAINQLVRSTGDMSDGLSAETAEAMAMQAYQAAEARGKFGRNSMLSRFTPHIGERKDSAAALETMRLMGDNMYAAFKEIKGDEFEAFWGDLEWQYGTSNRGQIAQRWLVGNFALHDADGNTVALMDDLVKQNNLGRRFRLTKNGEKGTYTFLDVEALLDRVRSFDGSWQSGLRREAKKADGSAYAPGEKLLEDLKSMSRAEWLEEINRSGLNMGVTRVSESSADAIWRMANGPEVDEFWNGRMVNGVRVGGYRSTFAAEVTGTTSRFTRVARDVEVLMTRAIVRAWATGKGMTEEEFIKLHHDDIPVALTNLSVLKADDLLEVRDHWVRELMDAGTLSKAYDPVDAERLVAEWSADEEFASLHLSDASSGDYWLATMPMDEFDNMVESLNGRGTSTYYSMPGHGYENADDFARSSIGWRNAIVRIRYDPNIDAGYLTQGKTMFNRSEIDATKHIEVLTPSGWEPMKAVKSGNVSVPARDTRNVAHPEVLHTAPYIYPDMVGVEKTGIHKIDFDALLIGAEERYTKKYTGSGHKHLNAWLRELTGMWYQLSSYEMLDDDVLEEMRDALDGSLRKGQLPERTTLYRGVHLGEIPRSEWATDFENLWPIGGGPKGSTDTFYDPGFVSTSTVPGSAQGFAEGMGTSFSDSGRYGGGANPDVHVHMEIDAPAGMHANLVEGTEDEIILPRGITFEVLSRRVSTDWDGAVHYHFKVRPTSGGMTPGVNKLGIGEPGSNLRAEGRMLQDAVQDPDYLREMAQTSAPNMRESVTDDVETAIAKAELAKPHPVVVKIGGLKFGPLTPTDILDDIKTTLEPDTIEYARKALSDLRDRVRELMSSDIWNPYTMMPEGGRHMQDGADTRLLTALGTVVIQQGGFRTGLPRVLRVVDLMWAHGPAYFAGKSVDPTDRLIASHIVRGIRYGIEQPYLDSATSDATDALLGNTTRRATGRVDTVQPILADDSVAEAAGYFTSAAVEALRRQGIDISVESAAVGPTRVIPATHIDRFDEDGIFYAADPDAGRAAVDTLNRLNYGEWETEAIDGLNSYLRKGYLSGGRTVEVLDENVAAVDALVRSSVTSQPTTVYRGQTDRGLTVGSTFSDTGFTFTTTDRSRATTYLGHHARINPDGGQVLIEYQMPVGTPLYPRGGTDTIIPKGEEWMVTGERMEDGVRVVTVEPAAAAPPAIAPTLLPLFEKDTTLIPTGETEYVRNLGGSTGALQVRDGEGNLYVEKSGASAGHIIEEAITDDVYRALGVPVPNARMLTDEAGQPLKRAQMIEGATPLADIPEGSAEWDAVTAQLQQNFALDALLANWDVAGLVGDNVLIKDGVAYRVDNGGALRYRAMGELKATVDGGRGFWGETVSELVSLRNPNISRWGAKVFGSISDADIRRQVLDLDARRGTILATLPAELRQTVSARLDDMLDQTEGITPTPPLHVADGGPKVSTIGAYEHEHMVDLFNRTAVLANEQGFNGRTDWTAAEVASVAAQAREALSGQSGVTATAYELQRSRQHIAVGVTPGPGHELHKYAELFDVLSQKRYRAERHKLMQAGAVSLSYELKNRLGIIMERSDELGMGFFDGDKPSPTMPVYLLNSTERAQDAADFISYATGNNVTLFTPGPEADQIADFSQYVPRVTIRVPANDVHPRMAEKLAEKLGADAFDAQHAVAVKNADGSWSIHIMDPDGTLFPTLENGSVNSEGVVAKLNALDTVDIGDADLDVHVTYGEVYTAAPKLKNGSPDWDGYKAEITLRAEARGSAIGGQDLDAVRRSYTAVIDNGLRDAAPDNYGRVNAGRPSTRNLEDRRGHNVLGVTSPRSAISAVIRGFASADPLTGLHELIHVFSLAGADPSLRQVVSKAYDEFHVGNDAAKNTQIAALEAKAAAATNKSARSYHLNKANALRSQLASPHPSEWSIEHEEFFVHLVLDYINRAVPGNPELANAFEHFRNWMTVMKSDLSKPGMVPLTISPQMDAVLGRLFQRKGVDTVSYSVEQQTMRMAGQQALRSAWDEAHATHFYKRDRSMLERSINHPYIGLYPASYMWGKILPEMLRFLALRPFGLETPFLAWNVAREVSDSVTAQAELDESFRTFLEENEDAMMLFSMMFPGLPHEVPANASLPVRRIAEQGLEAQRAYAEGTAPEDVKDIDFFKGSQDAIQYALGPAGTVRTFSEVVGMAGNVIRTLSGGVVGGPNEGEEEEQNVRETLPVR